MTIIHDHGSHIIPGGSFNPAGVGNLAHWYRADVGLYQDTGAATPAVADADRVARWNDQAGTDNPVQATAANRATLKLNIQNGRQVVRFDGISQVLQVTYAAALAQPYTIFIVYKQTADTYVLDGHTNIHPYFAHTAPNQLFNAGTSLSYADALPIGWSVFTLLANGASSLVRKDGVQKVAGNAGANNHDGISLGASAVPNGWGAVDIGEVLVYSADKTSNFAVVEAGLKARWGTP